MQLSQKALHLQMNKCSLADEDFLDDLERAYTSTNQPNGGSKPFAVTVAANVYIYVFHTFDFFWTFVDIICILYILYSGKHSYVR